MEDGTVSIFGLVFGVAVSAANSRVVLLAGSTGAAAAAIAMMAGTYLDALSTRGQAQACIAQKKQAIEQNRPSELREVMERLRGVGLDDKDICTIIDVLDRHPDLLLKVKIAFELQIAGMTTGPIWATLLFQLSVPTMGKPGVSPLSPRQVATPPLAISGS